MSPKKHYGTPCYYCNKSGKQEKKTRRNSGPTPLARGVFCFPSSLPFFSSSPFSPLPHFLDGNTKLVGCSAISARSCPGPVRYPWGSIVELAVPPDETPRLMTQALHPHNTNVLQSITYAKSPYPPDRSNTGHKN